MFLVSTRNFPPELGGMQVLMGGLSACSIKTMVLLKFSQTNIKIQNIYDKKFQL